MCYDLGRIGRRPPEVVLLAILIGVSGWPARAQQEPEACFPPGWQEEAAACFEPARGAPLHRGAPVRVAARDPLGEAGTRPPDPEEVPLSPQEGPELAPIPPTASGDAAEDRRFGRGDRSRYWDVRRAAAVPDDATLVASGAVIGRITVRALDIFDPDLQEENRLAFRLANRLHRTTQPHVVREHLLFRTGDPYSPRVLEESERLLRGASFFYDARVRPIAYVDNQVEIEVLTRDVWTLSVSGGFSRKGGENSTRFGVSDSNVLGSGKDLTFRRTSDVDRTAYLYRYRDSHLMGSRFDLLMSFSDNSDGNVAQFALERPFFSFDTKWAAGVRAVDEDRVDPLYGGGEVRARFRHRRRAAEASAGLSRGLVNGRAHRWRVGFTAEQDRFETVPDDPLSLVMPQNRDLSYPWIGYSSVQESFIEVYDLDRLQRTEDVNLGREIDCRLGWSSPLFGGDLGQWVYRGSVRGGFRLGDGQLLLYSGRGEGRYLGNEPRNLIAGATTRYYLRDRRGSVFFVAFSLDLGEHLDLDTQLLLGGDNGLRGYPLRFVEGDRRYLLTIEQRLYTDWHLFRLVHVGGAIFFDAGRAWFERGSGHEDLGILKDVGIGLRLGSSRSARASLVHLDLAMPLDAGRGSRDVQFLITTKDTF